MEGWYHYPGFYWKVCCCNGAEALAFKEDLLLASTRDFHKIISGFAALKGTSVDVYPIGHIVEDFKALLSVITEASIAIRPSPS